MTRILTIGFTKKSAREFFGVLKTGGVKRLVDVRLNNQSQLAGFSKREDLAFFCEAVLGIDYLHLRVLAPTQEMLNRYRNAKGSWSEYEKRFLDLMAERRIESELERSVLDNGCLLCSEEKPHFCHRRLVAEYLKERWGEVSIEHLR
jgi:uncharacterized protein (DUF488 family)